MNSGSVRETRLASRKHGERFGVKRSLPAPQPLRTPEQIAEYLQMPEKTLADWRSKGIGPRYSKVGKHVRYRQADVDAWLESRASEAVA
jgi:excisionase family DNA binding protein